MRDYATPLFETEPNTLRSSAKKRQLHFWLLRDKPASSLDETLPDAMIAGSDVGSRSIRGFVGEDALNAQGLESRAVFVADRHGESPGVMDYPGTRLRTIEQILSSLNLVEIAREECSVPMWPVDE